MHTSCKKRVEWLLDYYKNKMTVSADNKIHVLDVGGDNINGGISWTSDFEVDTLDIVDTENVDIVVRDPYMWNDAIADDSYDLVVSLNTFQHIEFFWETIREISRVLKPDGMFILSMPSTRYDGKYPLCCWAVNIDGLYAIAKWGGLQVVEASVAGVPNCEVGDEWNHPLDDAILVACKNSSKFDVNVEDRAFPVNRRNVSNRKERLFYKLIQIIVEKGNDFWTEWYAKNFTSKVYIYGAGEVGMIFARLIGMDKVEGFIDRYAIGNVEGVEIYKVDQIEEKMYPVVISYISDYDSELTVKKELSDCSLKYICISELIETALK